MTTEISHVVSDMAISPGEVLQEEIEARGMSQKELAARLGRPPQVINEIIRAKKAITPDTAIGLGKVLGIDPQYWINLETDYRMTLARNREKVALADNVQWLDAYPIREMIKRGWITAGRDKVGRLKALLAFLEVAVPEPRAYQEARRVPDCACRPQKGFARRPCRLASPRRVGSRHTLNQRLRP